MPPMTTRRTLLAAVIGLPLGLAGPAAADEPLRIGFVYSSIIGDAGWTYQHDLGRLAVEEAFGDRVETVYVESIDGGADAERVFRQMASQGVDLIFGTSFNHMNPMARVAAQNPDKFFEHATGYTMADNLAVYHVRDYQARYLIGMTAGAMGDSLGVVASFPIPEVVRGINAMTLGARAVNPDFTTRVIWISSWFDPGLERTAADALLDQGVDVLAHFTDSPAVVQAAEEAGKFVIGLGDMRQYGENAHLTAMVYNWAPYYVERTQAVLDGTWESTNTWNGIEAGMLDIAPFVDAVPQEARDQVLAVMEEIREGAFHPFQGPLVAQDGSIRVPEGEVPEDMLALTMDFYVEGVEGALP